MNVILTDIQLLRLVYRETPNQALLPLYDKMIEDLKPKITIIMMESAQLAIEGNTAEESANTLGVSKAAFSQSAIKGMNRLAQFMRRIGDYTQPAELNGHFTMIEARRHLSYFSFAIQCYENNTKSISWAK